MQINKSELSPIRAIKLFSNVFFPLLSRLFSPIQFRCRIGMEPACVKSLMPNVFQESNITFTRYLMDTDRKKKLVY